MLKIMIFQTNLFFILTVILFSGYGFGQSETNEYSESLEWYFIPKITYESGRMLKVLELSPLRELEENKLLRCTYQNGHDTPVSILIIKRSNLIIINIYKIVNNQTVRRELIFQKGTPEFSQLTKVIEITDQKWFFAPLKLSEITYFSNFLGGPTLLFESFSNDFFASIAVLNPSIEPKVSERNFIRSLNEYYQVLNILNNWLELELPPRILLDSVKEIDPFGSAETGDKAKKIN